MQPESLPFKYEDFTDGELEQLSAAIKVLPPLPTGTWYHLGWVHRCGPLGPLRDADRVLTSIVLYPENAPALYWLRDSDGAFIAAKPDVSICGEFNKSYVGLRH